MNKTGLRLLVYFLFLSLLASKSLWAGQVITEDIRQWARETVAQEKALETIQAENTVSVLYFQNKSGRNNLNPLQKGIAVMLMTDLAKVKELTVVERARLEALVQELKLGMSGMVDSDSAPRLGQFLGAEYLVGGSISLPQGINEFAINSLRLNVPEEKIDGRAETRGELLTKIFEMEKDLLFKIIAHFNIQLTYEEKVELQKIPTESLLALMNLFQGMESSDTGDYLEAARLYQEALREDPEFGLARIFLEELRDLDLWGGVEKEVEAYSEPETEEWFQKMDNPRKDNEDPSDREIAADGEDQVDEGYVYAPPLADASSLQMALDNKNNNPVLDASIARGDFQPGNIAEAENQWGYAWDGAYEFGLQTIGQDENRDGIPDLFLAPDIMTDINDNPFLAYAVQVEEDRLNKRSLELLQTQADLLENAALVNDVMNVIKGLDEVRTACWLIR